MRPATGVRQFPIKACRMRSRNHQQGGFEFQALRLRGQRGDNRRMRGASMARDNELPRLTRGGRAEGRGILREGLGGQSTHHHPR